MSRHVHGKRSFTGNHPLLPAMRPAPPPFVPKEPTYTFLKWTLAAAASCIWKIWPAVLLHTLFAAAVTMLEIPNVMLTVMELGVVIGFVISYRAISGYDRYWMGRTAWSDVIRNARTMGRLIWYHVPVRLTPGAAAAIPRTPQELGKVMAEKRMALDLVEAFAVALKHHLRCELGIYYEDLYDLVRPLHDSTNPDIPHPTVASAIAPPTPIATSTATPPPASVSSASGVAHSSGSATLKPTHAAKRPTLSTPASTTADGLRSASTSASASASTSSLQRVLLPASNPAPEAGVLRRVAPDVIPFAGVFAGLGRWLTACMRRGRDEKGNNKEGVRSRELEEAETGENLPEEVLRCLSEWLSVLEERATVPGTSLGAMLAGIQTFEGSLTTLEHILTTPLPFVYSVHIRVVWLYLFLLPLQLVGDFGWHTVPAVSVGAFVYLGFVAAGEEIEQPFGYDDNDLDLDMFCRDIIRPDIRRSRQRPSASGANGVLLAPEVGTRATLHEHAYGGNMCRASLASLSDAVSIEEAAGRDTEAEAEMEEGVKDAERDARDEREAELVDVR
ncbi:Bestrophin, RFP-TM, chloride channel-domain-containing protein [Mycena rosella]|uniref:Bestrophin, RFP-TM, chloride channel-domain-containing protein n=1 Tax=Mycena rosella TaxID=1033263 RepID=A0AAD7FXP4_MYCRO|nr:Bestrophin, RFP-TM, chloride channel-domain-containing protein [Mycena rosella]